MSILTTFLIYLTMYFFFVTLITDWSYHSWINSNRLFIIIHKKWDKRCERECMYTKPLLFYTCVCMCTQINTCKYMFHTTCISFLSFLFSFIQLETSVFTYSLLCISEYLHCVSSFTVDFSFPVSISWERKLNFSSI